MDLRVYHAPTLLSRRYSLHAWIDQGKSWDVKSSGTTDGLLEFVVPDVPYVRALKFKFRTEDAQGSYWESDDFVRQIRRRDVTTVWTYDASIRTRFIPPGQHAHLPAQVLLHLVTASRFVGGWIYVWNPYDASNPGRYFPQVSRDERIHTSTFAIPLAGWMADGFHFKCVAAGRLDQDWEPDRANKVWRPADGTELWLKSGQVSLRAKPLLPTRAPFDLIHPATLSPVPQFVVTDAVEGTTQSVPALSTTPYTDDPRFVSSHYEASVYPDALYRLDYTADSSPESHSAQRLFPLNQSDPSVGGTLLVGANDWQHASPVKSRPIEIVVDLPKTAAAPQGHLGLGSAKAPFQTVPLVQQPDKSWLARFTGIQDQPHWFSFDHPDDSTESRAGGLISERRKFAPVVGGPSRWFTAESVFGLSSAGPIRYSDVTLPDRQQLLSSAFSSAIVASGVFDSGEMPHGATVVSAAVGSVVAGTYFVLSAPHAASAQVALLNRASPAGAAVTRTNMTLTPDKRYWWCVVTGPSASDGAEYRFILNDTTEVLDPASRAVTDPGHLRVQADELTTTAGFAAGPWSRVVDVSRIAPIFVGSTWTTPGWDSLLIYEMHASRFTNANKDAAGRTLGGFDQIRAELATPNGYLKTLPVTALELLPVHEFPADNSWGYGPALFFAVEGSYGSPQALAQCIRAAHDAGKGVFLDLVYNHLSDDSPLLDVAADVYTDGRTAWGPMINFDNAVCKEYFRQATIYMWDAFSIDGFRFDSTETIINGGVVVSSTPYVIANGSDGKPLLGSGGGWEFLKFLRDAVRKAADSLNRPWPYLCGENNPDNWPMTKPDTGVQDGQWNFLLSGSLGDIAYKIWNPDNDPSSNVKYGMDTDQTWLRPYYESVRYGESHDTASGQDNGNNRRIPARPPFRQGFQAAKSIGTLAILCNGVPMIFMGQEGAEIRPFSFDNLPGNPDAFVNPQTYIAGGGDQSRVLSWFNSILGLRLNPSNGLRGDDGQQVRIGRKTVAFSRGLDGRFFVICTFGTSDNRQDSSWLGLPGNASYKEVFNSSWPAFSVEFEAEQTNGGYDASIYSGQILNLPYIGAVILEKR